MTRSDEVSTMRVRDHGHLAEWAALVGDDLPDDLEVERPDEPESRD